MGLLRGAGPGRALGRSFGVTLWPTLVQHFGWDPLWYGVVYLICMQLGLLTPPFGMLLFTMRGVAPKEIPTREIFAAVTPYVLMGVLMIALVLAVPGLATGLPALLLGK